MISAFRLLRHGCCLPTVIGCHLAVGQCVIFEGSALRKILHPQTPQMFLDTTRPLQNLC